MLTEELAVKSARPTPTPQHDPHRGASSEPAVPTTAAIDVGGRLRALREARKYSIRALAEASGLAVNTLSLIENGRTSPSVSTLQQLALTLAVPITAFFEVEPPQLQMVFIKAGQQRSSNLPHGSLADLGAGMADRSIEPLLLTLDPGAGSGPDPIVHTGQEFVYGLAGRITYTVAAQVYLLEPGDSLLFVATLPHGWHNEDSVPAQALLVLCPGEPVGHAARRHRPDQP